MVVENKPGANTQIAAEFVAKSAPDGYTLLLGSEGTFVMNPFLYGKLPYDPVRDFAPITALVAINQVLAVNPSVPVHTIGELIALAKRSPATLSYGTTGFGSASHLNMEQLDRMAGIKTVAVHYRGGGDTVKDLLSGEVKMMFSSIAPVQDFVRDGRLVGLATTGPKRDPAFPDLPTIAESGYPGFDVRLWIGLTAPAGTPKDIIGKLADANRKALESPDIQKALAAQGFSPMIGSAEDFDAFYRSERDKWGKVVKETGMDKD